jgi:hypothetical protein
MTPAEAEFRVRGVALMNRKILPLAAAVVALPAVALAASPAAVPAEIVVVPVAMAPVPFMAAPAIPVALIRQMNEMQRAMQVQMAALEQLAAAPLAPTLAMAGPPALQGGTTRITMVSSGGPSGVCSEQMEIMPGNNGRMHVFVRRSAGCTPQAAALPGPHEGPKALHPSAHAHLPPNALPPPSKVIEADYAVPGRARAEG